MDELLKLEHVSKNFGGVQALSDVSMEVKRGEIHAVIGENGAGKSTFMNIAAGLFPPSQGEYYFEGEQVKLRNPQHAHELGISMIHQELSLAPALSVAENIYAGRLIASPLGIINLKAMNGASQKLLEKLCVNNIRSTDIVRDLSISKRQLVEICKAIAVPPKLLIMDEPTASLTAGEVETVLFIMRELKTQGISILFITHKLEEVKAVADRITILKDGKLVTTTQNDERISLQDMINFMVGRDFTIDVNHKFISKEEYSDREKVLVVKNISVKNHVKDVSFELYKGEILGLTGLIGAGRSELLGAVYGSMRKNAGEIYINGKKVSICEPKDAINLGFGFVAEDRKTQGIYPKMSVEDNITSVRMRVLANKLGVVRTRKIRGVSQTYCKSLSIRTPSGKQIISNLSGGNQQKCILARWLANSPQILFLDEPTHGIDVSTKAEIYRLIGQLAEDGCSIVMLSSELPEVLGICDRILVMHHGELRGVLNHEEADEVKIMRFTLEEQVSEY